MATTTAMTSSVTTATGTLSNSLAMCIANSGTLEIIVASPRELGLSWRCLLDHDTKFSEIVLLSIILDLGRSASAASAAKNRILTPCHPTCVTRGDATVRRECVGRLTTPITGNGLRTRKVSQISRLLWRAGRATPVLHARCEMRRPACRASGCCTSTGRFVPERTRAGSTCTARWRRY